ncbi:MAG: methyltransferase domain-containing protein [Flavobacteriaceae bacterium]|nr:methyltransferase domain-containing protein [Flavobacteriaceae bacterium]
MILLNTKKRSTQPEIMDEFDFQGRELEKVLDAIDHVNHNLGGYKVTINAILQLLQKNQKQMDTQIKIVEFGCGSGASLRRLADFFRKTNYTIQFIGIDANPHIIKIAKSKSNSYDEIQLLTMDVFSQKFQKINADITFASLTLHHFKEKEIINLIQVLYANTNFGIVINDLHRSKLAYRLFQLYALFFIRSKVAYKDGLISILRGFKKEDFDHYARQLNLKNCSYQIQWKWAFRFQWIIFR